MGNATTGRPHPGTRVARALAVLLAVGLACLSNSGRADSVPAVAGKVALRANDPAGHRWTAADSLRYKRNWGVNLEGVKVVASGYMLAFRYRVLDAAKARPLNDKKTSPFIIDEATGVRLSVPAMEQVGELRQSTEPQEGRSYFIIFGNPGKLVKRGGRVTVAIGGFTVEGMTVE